MIEYPKLNSLWQLPKFELHVLNPSRNSYAVVIVVVDEGERIKKQLARMRFLTGQADIVIADGDSQDGSLEHSYLREQGVRSLLIKKSPGNLSTQLRMGLAYCLSEGYKGIICMDGNDKDGVEAISDFIAALENGYDFVQGSRYLEGGKHENTPWDRDLAIRLIHTPLLSRVARFRYTDTANGFKAFSSKFLLDPRVKPFRDVFVRYNLQWYLTIRSSQLGYKVKEIPVTRIYPPSGKTPTKIKGIMGRARMLWEVFLTALGEYHPEDRCM